MPAFDMPPILLVLSWLNDTRKQDNIVRVWETETEKGFYGFRHLLVHYVALLRSNATNE